MNVGYISISQCCTLLRAMLEFQRRQLSKELSPLSVVTEQATSVSFWDPGSKVRLK